MFTLTKENLIKIAKGAGIAVGGALLTYPFTPTSTPNFLPFFQHIYN